MKLLLTSGGIANASIAKALFDLVGKRPEDTSLVFVPTAANMKVGDKTWFINDLTNLKKLNLKCIEIADISAVGEDIWRPKMESADVLFFEGGDTPHLMRWINKSGLAKLLPELLRTKVYVGSSAGSMVACKDLNARVTLNAQENPADRLENVPCLNLVDFYFIPHLNASYRPRRTKDAVQKAVEGINKKIYVLDDQSALKVVDGKVEIVSEGKWFMIN